MAASRHRSRKHKGRFTAKVRKQLYGVVGHKPQRAKTARKGRAKRRTAVTATAKAQEDYENALNSVLRSMTGMRMGRATASNTNRSGALKNGENGVLTAPGIRRGGVDINTSLGEFITIAHIQEAIDEDGGGQRGTPEYPEELVVTGLTPGGLQYEFTVRGDAATGQLTEDAIQAARRAAMGM